MNSSIFHSCQQFTLNLGDCRDVLSTFSDNIFDSVVTDPPYELGFMGKKWDSTGIAYDAQMWEQVLRVLKPGGYLLSFGGSRTYHRMACAIEDAGFEIRDQIQWIYGSGFPKSLNCGEGWGTALKPAHEPICMARKSLIGTVAANLAEHGTGAINIDACRVGVEIHGVDSSQMRAVKRGIRSEDGFGLNTLNETEGEMLSQKGRWPANIVHDGSDEVLAAFPSAPGAMGPVRPDSGSGIKTTGILGKFGANNTSIPRGDEGSAARFFYCAKASRQDRDEGLDITDGKPRDDSRKEGNPGGENPRNRGTQVRANFHPTVKPIELMRWLVRMVTQPGGVVLDPFAGSGTTGKAAILERMKFVGCDISSEYCEIQSQRLYHAISTVKAEQEVPTQGVLL